MTIHLRDVHGTGPAATRSRRGALACLSGAMAEDSVAARYQAAGADLLARRWRGRAGEIDLIVQQDDCVIFVEVKKSRTHELAALRLDRRQMDRICGAALEYCGTLPLGSLTEMRFDVALVDETGRIDVIENAFGEN
ncbi:MAG: YraN family protein [Paracoccus sp. (in: a-proteobacteria)]|uniref:YraN family protein n=1 Tax=Paracoccus sp. TaxID=267 RepID=UPI0026DEB53B|nr:YraN family protein [Paracoccus sp. (in: a-proteobacteria)]MDO5619937.1 YraN family protein [Paracoccus sp. (in: a-proteobacteria)]